MVLEQHPDSRNSDIVLMIGIWSMFYPDKIHYPESGSRYVFINDLFDLPREDNISRLRRHFQNYLNLYLPTSLEVVKQRKINEEKWREAMGYPPLQNLGQQAIKI